MQPSSTQPVETRSRGISRYLRIAFSVACGVACVLLIMLWVRGYSHTDSITRVGNDLVLTRFGSESGIFFLGWVDYKTTPNIDSPDVTDGWEYQEYDGSPHYIGPSWNILNSSDAFGVFVPAWFVTLGALTTSFLPWLPWSNRFSLRALLIATTLLALILGLIYATTR